MFTRCGVVVAEPVSPVHGKSTVIFDRLGEPHAILLRKRGESAPGHDILEDFIILRSEDMFRHVD
jgi:hypothetical protein